MSVVFDLVFRAGLVVDGTGNPALVADVGVIGGRIAAVGDLSQSQSEREINISTLAIAPGFIDVHTHSDVYVLDNPKADVRVRQGVTTEVIGNCGFTPYPAGPRRGPALQDTIRHILKSEVQWDWDSLSGYAERVAEHRTAVNIVPLVGHATLRLAVMGEEQRPPTREEMSEMQRLLAETMEQGAFGFSTGLTLAPSSYADTEEVIELSRVAARYGGFYATHSRLWAGWHKKAVEEAVEIGKKAGLPVQISHQTIIDPHHWGEGEQIVEIMEKARAEGVDVTFDVYPYTAGASPFSQLLPSWVQVGGVEAMLTRLCDKALRQQLHKELEGGWFGGLPWAWDHVIISEVEEKKYKGWEGKSIEELAQDLGIDPIETMLKLIEESGNRVDMVMFNRCEEDVKYFMSHPLGMIGSDSYYTSPHEGQGKPHPRNYGTFPRVLGKYVREEKLMPIEKAIYKMTGFPAERLGLKNRGRIAAGLMADLVVFDPQTIIDRAGYSEPRQYPEGVHYVMVNGQMVIDNAAHTRALPGSALLHS